MHFLWLMCKVLLVLAATGTVAYELYVNRNRLGFVWLVWKRFRPRMLVEVLIALGLTIALVHMFYTYVPLLRWGWLNSFVSGGGNIILAPVLEGSSSPRMLVRVLPPIFFAALMVACPFLAYYEEKQYRRGYYEWREIAKQSVKFGLAHLWVGIPLAAGIALILPGFFFAWKYRSALDKIGMKGRGRADFGTEQEDEAVMVSTAYHTLYNTLLIVLLLVITITAI